MKLLNVLFRSQQPFYELEDNLTAVGHNGSISLELETEDTKEAAKHVEDMEIKDTAEEYLVVIGTSLRTNIHYYKVYMIYMNLVVNGLVPLFCLVVLNSLIYRKLRCRGWE